MQDSALGTPGGRSGQRREPPGQAGPEQGRVEDKSHLHLRLGQPCKGTREGHADEGNLGLRVICSTGLAFGLLELEATASTEQPA